MNKKVVKVVGLLIFISIVLTAIFNIYSWIVSGKQYIKINTSSRAYTNSDLYVSIIAQKQGTDLETQTKIKLLNSKGHKVKNVNIKYEENNAILSIPDIESGNYYLEAKVSSEAGKDTIQKEIYIANGNSENTTITLDKGIYKPGDLVNYRALLTSKETDEPISEDINVSIYDGNDNRVYNENVKTSDYGIIGGSFQLANEVNSGLYKLVVKSKTTETTKQFKVNPYVTPKYEVKIEYDKESYLVGENANITFNAKYFFGEAVQNADINVYVDSENYKTLKTNSEGTATMEYKIKDAKTYNIKAEAVDASNYYVEATSSFTAGTDVFEIQLLPEYGALIEGKKNDIYVFTSQADGTPVKTYITVSSDKYTKQIATDENGIGKFSIDINQTSSSNSRINGDYYNLPSYNKKTSNNQIINTKEFAIVAEDIKGNKINKKLSLNIEQKTLLLSTNKVKYEQGEDIKIKVSSINENTKNIYFFKNDKLIKMASTELEDTTINLGETYGLIDIYLTENSEVYNKNNSYKKTIFIKPEKQLNINISTDKEEYKPGEKITISFDTENENKTNVEAALLVSMLDNSILSLSNNDLSIDNIKLALQNIKFSNDLDAATLYSCIIEDKSEQTMMALLLKQSNNDINISETRMLNSEQEHKSAIISILSIAIIAITLIVFLLIKLKVFRKGTKTALKNLINFIMFDAILVVTGRCIIEELFWRIDYSWWIFGITTAVGLATYILFLSKLDKQITKTSVSIIITIFIILLIAFLIGEFEVPALIIISIFVALLLIFAILEKLSELHKWKIDKYMKIIKKEILYTLKFLGAVVIALITGGIFNAIIKIEGIIVPVTIICIYPLNYIFNRLGKGVKTEEETGNKENIKKWNWVIVVLAIIGIMAIGFVLFSLIEGENGIVNSAPTPDYNYNRRTTPGGLNPNTFDITESESSSNGFSNILDGVGELFSNDGNTVKSKAEQNMDEETSNTNKEQTENVTDENIRNIFLESMCFIPELITTNGTANVDLNLSHNITTWTIQTVGNTKDGRIGYEILNNVKVFKDFFVDFELPKNLVETDKVSIPVTVYNYTESPINTVLKIKEESWFTLENNNININVEAKSTSMAYIPIVVLNSGNNKFRAEVSNGELTDIVEKECTVATKGYKVEKVVSTGNLDEDISEDILFLDDIIKNTAKAKIKIYPSTMAQTIEGMENIFKMPTGCFEQISSSLYPNILALKYMEEKQIVNEEVKTKALSYITSGYQKLLTYEVKGESGGYSLYGESPAETVLTAYGLMEISDLSEVYNVDNNVIEKMTNYLYKKQNANGTFTITGSHVGGASSRETLALNAYIAWALSETNPKDDRLNKTVEYLKNKLDDIDDNYTLALVANTLANVNDKDLNNVLKILVNNTKIGGGNAYITSNVVDYYGSKSNAQTIQTVALTSMALSKGSYNPETNKLLLNYLISKKDKSGTWYNTQATILALKALNIDNEKSKLENQTMTVRVNSDEQKIEIKDNPLEFYELTFENLSKENKLSINIEKGNAYYEVVEEYYIPYENVDTKDDNIEVKVEYNNDLKVNDILKANIKVINRSKSKIANGMVTISIPQGFTVIEESLMKLESKGIIEKYETSYSSVNIYLRNFDDNQMANLDVWFRASYPAQITGMSVKAYDYYNPDVEGKALPIEISVKQ